MDDNQTNTPPDQEPVVDQTPPVVEQTETPEPVVETPPVVEVPPPPPEVVVPPVVEVPPPVVVPPPAPAAAPAPVQTVVVTTEIDIAKLDTLGRIAYQNILDYIEAMAPRKPVNITDGVRNQVSLFRSLTNIINSLDTDFNVVFGTVLRLFEEHKNGVFHETRVFRHMEHITLGDTDRKSFQRLLNMFKLTADPKGRALALKQINLDVTLEFISEAGRQRVMKFFNKQ